MKPLSECKLYAFIDSAFLNGRDPLSIAQELCDGGADLIQLRAKDWDKERISSLAAQLLPLTTRSNVRLVINDHFSIAKNIGAPLCHLGQEDFFNSGYAHVSQLAGDNTSAPQIGLSTHSPEQASRAIAAGAAYIAIGPVFQTPTKPGRPAVTLDYVRWAAKGAGSTPWFAIGGINLTNIDDVLQAGARRICVVSAILNQSSVAKACAAFREKIDAV